MNIPGANLLGVALRVIQPQTLGHRAWQSRTVNAAGDFVGVFAASVDISGSMQAVKKTMYQTLGLNLSKNYSTLYTQANVQPLARDREGDLVTYGGKTWQCESDMNWVSQDGWRKLLCVEIPA
jgi:hypothetical protein